MTTVPVIGILSIIFGGVSLLPFCGIIAPIGLVLGLIGIVKKQFGTAIIGAVVSLLGALTSPILWAMMGNLFCATIAHCQKPDNLTQPISRSQPSHASPIVSSPINQPSPFGIPATPSTTLPQGVVAPPLTAPDTLNSPAKPDDASTGRATP